MSLHFAQSPSHNKARLATWTQISTTKMLYVLINPVFFLHPLNSINCGWGQPAAQTRQCPLLGRRAAHGALLAGPPADPATKESLLNLAIISLFPLMMMLFQRQYHLCWISTLDLTEYTARGSGR